MTSRLILICHGSTAAIRESRFPLDEPLDVQGEAGAAALAARVPKADRCLSSPELRTRQTAEALGLAATIEAELRDCDFGAWRGRSLKDVHASEPDAVATWLRDPAATPHGGESLLGVMKRVADWLCREQGRRGTSIVITHAAIVRAAILCALGAPADSFWRIDIAPLSCSRLSSNGSRWSLSAGCSFLE